MATGELRGRWAADEGEIEISTPSPTPSPPSPDTDGDDAFGLAELCGCMEGAAECASAEEASEVGQAVCASMCGRGGSSAPTPTSPPSGAREEEKGESERPASACEGPLAERGGWAVLGGAGGCTRPRRLDWRATGACLPAELELDIPRAGLALPDALPDALLIWRSDSDSNAS